MVLSLQESGYGNRWSFQIHPAAPTSTIVVERCRSSEHSTVATPARAAARNCSSTFEISSGPIASYSTIRMQAFGRSVVTDEQTRLLNDGMQLLVGYLACFRKRTFHAAIDPERTLRTAEGRRSTPNISCQRRLSPQMLLFGGTRELSTPSHQFLPLG